MRPFILALAMVTACGAARVAALEQVASRDLRCPREQLSVDDSHGSRLARVRGCGREVSYVALCEPGCGWVRLDSDAGTAP